MKIRISGFGIAGALLIASAFGCLFVAITNKNPAAGILAVLFAYFGSDAVWFELSYVWTNGGLQQKYEAWKARRALEAKRKKWAGRQLEHLFTLVNADNRWMAHDKTASTLTQRYLDALDKDWYAKHFQEVHKLREELGLDPMRPKIVAPAYQWIYVIKRESDDLGPEIQVSARIPMDLDEEKRSQFAYQELERIKKGFLKEYPNVIDEFGDTPGKWSVTILQLQP
jgi:hypothetical protein